jgi:hypothetical protein
MKGYTGQYSINTREYPMFHLVDSTEWNVYCCSPNHCHSMIFNAEPSEAADLAPVFWGNVCSPALLFIFLCLLCLYFPWIVLRLFPCTISYYVVVFIIFFIFCCFKEYVTLIFMNYTYFLLQKKNFQRLNTLSIFGMVLKFLERR